MNWRDVNLHTYCHILWHRVFTSMARIRSFESFPSRVNGPTGHCGGDLFIVEELVKKLLRRERKDESLWNVFPPTTIQHQSLFLFECGKWWKKIVGNSILRVQFNTCFNHFPPTHPTPFLGEFTRCELHLCILHCLGHHFSRFLCRLGAQHGPEGANHVNDVNHLVNLCNQLYKSCKKKQQPTWPWKNNHFKMYLQKRMVIFHCYVSLLEGLINKFLDTVILKKQLDTHTQPHSRQCGSNWWLHSQCPAPAHHHLSWWVVFNISGIPGILLML